MSAISTVIGPSREAGAVPRVPALPSRREMLRLRALARFARLTRWEFWPSWAVYLPLMPYILWLALRHRGLGVCTHANPAIPFGGIVGESKWAILQLLPQRWVVPTAYLPPAPPRRRAETLERIVRERGWAWPIILKPDVGQRGAGVRRIASPDAARAYFQEQPMGGAVLAQQLHPGPFEAGVFFYRLPGETRGRILSITDKRFPVVRGDGRSTVRTLVWRHPRYRAQAEVLLEQLGARAETVPAEGEAVAIGHIGNHCRGTMFLDGAHLITPALEAAVSAIASEAHGFFFGRFDVRYSDPAEFAAGRGFQVVELNGLSSESTNMYDPGHGYWQGQRILRSQWRIAYRIGAEVLARGSGVQSTSRGE